MIDTLREARAALLNPNLTDMERAVSVRRIEACIDALMIQERLGTPPAPTAAHGPETGSGAAGSGGA